MCGGGERRARKRAEKEAKRARRDAARREREAIARAEAQAKRMIEQQKKSYAAMQAMIPKAPPIPKARPASTTTETTTGIKTKKVENKIKKLIGQENEITPYLSYEHWLKSLKD